MSKIIRTRKPSVLPFYAGALVFVVLCAVLPVYKLWALLVALGGAAASRPREASGSYIAERRVSTDRWDWVGGEGRNLLGKTRRIGVCHFHSRRSVR